MFPPERIVCLTEETVGVSLSPRRGAAYRRYLWLCGPPAESPAREATGLRLHYRRHPEDPRSEARSCPHLFDLQADIAATLIRNGVDVHAFNQRTIPQILDMIRTLGALVGATDRADRLAGELAAAVASARVRAAELPRRPKVYFEEWDDPMISGIGWVSELIDAAGGLDIFADRASCKSAKERIVTAEEVIRREPEIIVGSWCGKKFRPEKVVKRRGV